VFIVDEIGVWAGEFLRFMAIALSNLLLSWRWYHRQLNVTKTICER